MAPNKEREGNKVNLHLLCWEDWRKFKWSLWLYR